MPLFWLKTWLKIWLLTGAIAFSALSAAAIQVTDARGRSVHLERPAERIISLAPHLTENLFSIGAGERLVGTVSYSDYPKAALALPRVGDASQLDLEAILALQPDLVLAWHAGNPKHLVQQLDALGLPVYWSQIPSFAALSHELQALGQLTGQAAAAQAQVKKLEQQTRHWQAASVGQRRVTVFYQVWERPLMTINGEHLISRMIQRCGGETLFAASRTLTPRVSEESLIAANPEVIMTTQAEGLVRWQRFPQLQAVRQKQLIALPADWISRPTLRTLDGLAVICQHLEKVRQSTDP